MMKVCNLCGGNHRVFFNRKHEMNLCEGCRNEIHNNGGELLEVHSLPEFGEVAYDYKGRVICHVCGKAYDKVLSHVYYKHKMRARDYKKTFGLDVRKGLCSDDTRKVLRGHVEANFEKVVKINLLEKGKETRFEKGSKGRTRDMVSEQTLNRLSKSFKQSCEIDKE